MYLICLTLHHFNFFQNTNYLTHLLMLKLVSFHLHFNSWDLTNYNKSSQKYIIFFFHFTLIYYLTTDFITNNTHTLHSDHNILSLEEKNSSKKWILWHPFGWIEKGWREFEIGIEKVKALELKIVENWKVKLLFWNCSGKWSCCSKIEIEIVLKLEFWKVKLTLMKFWLCYIVVVVPLLLMQENNPFNI